MSTVNFVSMQNFDLYAFDQSAFDRPICPECGSFLYENACDACGSVIEDMDDCETEFDVIEDMEWCRETERTLNEFNEDLRFFNLKLASGYYTGYQIAVTPVTQWGTESYSGYVSGSYRCDTLDDYDPHNLDNDDTRYYYDLCRSEAIRKYDAEARKVRRWMKNNLPDLGFERIVFTGVFSNGEAVYEIAREEARA